MTEPGLPIPPHRTPAARAQKLIPAAMSVLAAIGVVGLVAVAVAAWPFAPGEMRWRVQAIATLLTAVPQLAFLLAMISVAGVYAGQHSAVRAAAISFFVLSGALIVLVPLFALDFMSVRHLLTQPAVAGVTHEGVRVGVSTAFLIPFMIWAASKGWAASKPDPDAERGEGHGLIVGR
jgi:hypothetical protein